MPSGPRYAWRRRSNKSRAARIAGPLAIPVALGLTLGIIIAVSGGNATTVAQSAMGSCASAAASGSASAPAASAPAASAPAAASSAAAVPCPSASGSAAATNPAPTADFAIPPNNAANRAGLAGANAVDAAGNAFSFTQNADQAAASTNCTVSVPANPLTAQGLASPWVP